MSIVAINSKHLDRAVEHLDAYRSRLLGLWDYSDIRDRFHDVGFLIDELLRAMATGDDHLAQVARARLR